MSANVTRRGFFKLATEALWALPVVAGGVLAVTPEEALAVNGARSETSGGSVDPGAPDATIIVLEPSEVGFYVVDMGTEDKKPVAGAHVKITSRYNGEVAEGDTDDLGMLSLDIAKLAVFPDDGSLPDEYFCNATLEVTRDGYRNFKTGILPLQGAKGHYVPTRLRTRGLPYPESVSFDEWDVLYTENLFNISPKNDLTHELSFTIRDIPDSSSVDVMLLDVAHGTIPKSMRVLRPDDSLEGSVSGKLLQKGLKECWEAGAEFKMRIVCTNRARTNYEVYDFPLGLKLEEVVFEEPTQVNDIIAEPLNTSMTDGVSIPLPSSFPLGKGLFQMWLPQFPVSIYCDPSGYVQLTMKTPNWGYRTDFGDSDKNGWQWFPRQSVDQQVSDAKAGWDSGMSTTTPAGDSSKGFFSHASFTPKLMATVNLQFVACARWVMAKQYFQGDAVAQFVINMGLSLTEQFFAGPIPLFVNFTISAIAATGLGVGFTVPLPEDDEHPNLVHVITAMDKYQWDYTNTGLTFTYLIRPSLSVGVGVKGAMSVSLRGSLCLTYFLGATYRGNLDKSKYPLPHQKATYSFKAEVVIEFFLFTRTCTLWERSNPNWYDNWKGGLSAQEEEQLEAQDGATMTMEEFLAGMKPVSDAMLGASKEFSMRAQGGLSALSVDGEAAADNAEVPEPQIASEYREDVLTGPDDEPLACMVYTVTLPTVEDVSAAVEAPVEQADAAPEQSQATPESQTSSEGQTAAVAGGAASTEEQVASQATADEGASSEPAQVEAATEMAVELAAQEEAATTDAPAESVQVEAAATGTDADPAQAEASPKPGEVPGGETLVAAAEETADTTEGTEVAEAPTEEEGETPPATITYAIPSYEPLWDHETSSLWAQADDGSVGIGDEPGVKGIGSSGGVRPSLDVKMFGDQPIYGNPRIDLVTIQGETIALRIGSVEVGGKLRTRLIATVIDGPRRPSGTSQVLDFPLPADVQASCPREDLCDYEYSAAAAELRIWDGYARVERYDHRLNVTIVSGRRTDEIVNAATDLVFSYVQFNYNMQSGGDPFTGIYAYVSWRGSRLFDGFSEYAYTYHCLSNVHIKHTTDETEASNDYIFCLDRAANTPADTLLGGTVNMLLIIVKYKHTDKKVDFHVVNPATVRRLLGGDTMDPTAYELDFWPEASGIDYFLIRGEQWTSYYSIGLTDAGILNKTFYHLGDTTGGELAHYWKNEFYDSYLGILDYYSPKCLVCKEDGQLTSVHFKYPLTNGKRKMEWADVGPAAFGVSSFGVWGDFVYWPVARYVEEGYETELNEYGEEVPVESRIESRVMASRLWDNKFSEPFILADLDHFVDNIVSVSGTATALTMVSNELVDRDTNTGKLWYTAIPFVRTATAIAASCDMPFVVPCDIAEFHVTIRNDGNTYIKGCSMMMYDDADRDLGDAWEPCDYAQLEFGELTLVPSIYNPPDDQGRPTNHASDYALAPGQAGVFKVGMIVPEEWEGSHKIIFVAGWSWYDMKEESEAELESQSEAGPVVKYIAKPGEVPMDVLTVRPPHTHDADMTDAPVTVVDPTDANVQGADVKGADVKQAGGPQLPNTGDGLSTALAGGLALAGAAVLAYERRRAKNEEG